MYKTIICVLITFISTGIWALYEAYHTFEYLKQKSVSNIIKVDHLGSLRWKTWYITAILRINSESGTSIDSEQSSKAVSYMEEFSTFKDDYSNDGFWPNLNSSENMTLQFNKLNTHFFYDNLFERASNNTEYISSQILHNQEMLSRQYKDIHSYFLILNIVIWCNLIIIITILTLTSLYYLVSYKKSIDAVVSGIKKEKNKFIRYVFHEIRNPLQAVHLGLSQIEAVNTNMKPLLTLLPQQENENGKVLAQNRDSIIDDMKHATQIMVQLVNDALDIQQIEFGTFEIYKVHYKTEVLIRKSIAAVKSIADSKNIELNIYNNCRFVIVDPIRIQQVITNLLSNAIKFSQPYSEITLTWHNKGQLDIEDYGPGISREGQKRIFEPFNPAADHHQRGSGLGLSIVKSILKQHGVPIFVYSKPGHTKFTINFEICDGKCCDKRVSDESFHGQNKISEYIRHVKILLVEDNMVSQRITKRFLEKMNFNAVHVANNGEEAVELVKITKFDIILMDKEMPVMDGYEATKLIRQLDDSIIIIGLTGNALREDIEEFKQQGVNDVLTKPLHINSLLKLLDHFKIFSNVIK